MQNNGVIFKADIEGLIIILKEELEFTEIKKELIAKFKHAGDFFKEDMNIRIKLGKRQLSFSQKKQIINIFKNQPGLSVIEFINDEQHFTDSEQIEDTLLVKKTLRSGQSISFAGNIAIQGDVNPGAEVIADGDILVMGNFRGIAHAGARGKTSSTISAFRLQPTQLRIANYISRSPDTCDIKPDTPEVAFIKDRKIIIDHLRK